MTLSKQHREMLSGTLDILAMLIAVYGADAKLVDVLASLRRLR